MLPDESYGGRVAVGLGVLQGVAAFVVEQLGVGLGLQQRLRARHVPFASGCHQGGDADVGLQIGVGRVLQQDEKSAILIIYPMHPPDALSAG